MTRTAKAPISLSGGFDAYASIAASTKHKDDDTRPLEKGEFAKLLKEQPGDSMIQLAKAADLFKALSEELPKARLREKETQASIKSHTQLEIQKAARSIIGAMRRKDVTVAVVDSVRLQVYQASILADNYEKAIGLYPLLKSMVGERMRGIYVLAENRRETVLRHAMLSHYFESVPNAEDGLLKIFQDKSMTSATPDPKFQPAIYHFGTKLPIFYLLANCSQIAQGLCGNCSGTSEERLRKILGSQFDVVKPGLIGRLCSFASSFV